MTSRFDVDHALRRALRARAEGDAGDLLWQIEQAIATTEQQHEFLRGLRGARRPMLVLIAAVLLLAMLVGVVAIGTMLRQERFPHAVPGDILLYAYGRTATAVLVVDPVTGRPVNDKYEISLPARSWRPMWLADGVRVLYGINGSIRVVNTRLGTDTNLARCVAAPDNCEVDISPDQSWLVMTGDGSQLLRLDLESGEFTQLFSVPLGLGRVGSPSISPDGQTVAFATGSDVYSVGIDGSDFTLLASHPDDAYGPWSIDWAPDGSEIAYVSSHDTIGDTYHLAVYAIRADGSGPRLVMQGGTCRCTGGGWGPPGLAWSPDGTQIAVITRNFRDAEDEGGLFVVPREGGEPRFILAGAVGIPAWQPAPAED